MENVLALQTLESPVGVEFDDDILSRVSFCAKCVE